MTRTKAKAPDSFLIKCKGVAVVLAAVSGLVLGLLNHFKETKDLRAKSGYEELSKQVENVSNDVRKLSSIVRQQAEEISTVQNWIINDRKSTEHNPEVSRIRQQVRARVSVTPPPPRKPSPWAGLPVQRRAD